MALALLFAGCQSPDHGPLEKRAVGRLTSRMTIAQVTERVQSESTARGYAIAPSKDWSYSLTQQEGRRTWTIYPQARIASPSSWFIVDDQSGAVDFVAPMIMQPSTEAAITNNSSLSRVAKALDNLVYPLPLEEFLRRAQLFGLTAESGGSNNETLFLDYTLQREKDSIERFEVRCYYQFPQGEFGPKLVVRAELAYWDSNFNRYILKRDRQ